MGSPAALETPPVARVVHQDRAHDGRCRMQKVATILPARLLAFYQAEKRFVNQGGRLQCVAGPLVPQMLFSQRVQLIVDEGYERSDDVSVSGVKSLEQSRDLARYVCFHEHVAEKALKLAAAARPERCILF
jgi:hypothetical protein